MGTIKIRVSKGGVMVVEAEGYVGASCRDATAAIEALGRVTSSEDKPEMYTQERGQDAQAS